MLVFTIEILKIKGGTKEASRCDVGSLEGCSEKEAKYVTAKKELGATEIKAEIARLKGMGDKKMADAQLGWLNRRLLLLSKLEAKDEI